MADALLTLNAGSSSIKFALFGCATPIPGHPVLIGQIDAIGTVQGAHFKARDDLGQLLDDSGLPLKGERPHHAASIILSPGCVAANQAGPSPASAIARCMASRSTRSRSGWTTRVYSASENSCRWRRCTRRATSPGLQPCVRHCLVCRTRLASTPPSTAVRRRLPGSSCRRAGTLDPGALLNPMACHGMDARTPAMLLYHESGLPGVSGISQDMRELPMSERIEATEAADLLCCRIVREIGSLAAAIDGLDAPVFTGGLGEHAALVRRKVCREIVWFGLELEASINAADAVRISMTKGRVATLVVPTSEEWMLTRHAAQLIALFAEPPPQVGAVPWMHS